MADLDERRVRDIAREEHRRVSLEMLETADLVMNDRPDYRALRRLAAWGRRDDRLLDALIRWAEMPPKALEALAAWGDEEHRRVHAPLFGWGEMLLKFRGLFVTAVLTALIAAGGGIWYTGLIPYLLALPGGSQP